MNSIYPYIFFFKLTIEKMNLIKNEIAIQVKRAINALAMELYRPPWK